MATTYFLSTKTKEIAESDYSTVDTMNEALTYEPNNISISLMDSICQSSSCRKYYNPPKLANPAKLDGNKSSTGKKVQGKQKPTQERKRKNTNDSDETSDHPASGSSKKDKNGLKSKMKTELCTHFTQGGTCKWGEKCIYAHGMQELKEKTHVTSQYKTRLCDKYAVDGFCPYGQRCMYIHENASTSLLKSFSKNFEDILEISASKAESENENLTTYCIKSQYFKLTSGFSSIQRLPVFTVIFQEGSH